MKNTLIKKLLIMLLVAGIFNCEFVLAKQSDGDIKELQKAIIETAQAFDRRDTNVQYCTYRKTYDARPEEATDDNTVYVVCSVFVESVYKDALGIDLPTLTSYMHGYAVADLDSEFVVAYYGSKEYPEKLKNKDKMIKDLAKIVQVGDVITVGGHTMLISSVEETDFMVLHAAGSNSNEKGTTAYETKGAIRAQNFSDYMTKNGSNRLTVLRPLANGKYFIEGNVLNTKAAENGKVTLDSQRTYYELTPAAKSRLAYPQMDIIKTGSFHNDSIVSAGDEITYTIKIKNNSEKAYKNLSITENISDKVTVTDKGNGTQKNNVITWKINVPSKSEAVIKYKVKVKDSTKKGDNIISEGTVANIKSATVTNIVGNKLDNTQIQLLKQSVEKNNKVKGINFINNVYKDIGYDLNFNNVNDIIKLTGNEISIQAPFSQMIMNGKINTFNKMNYFRKEMPEHAFVNGNKDKWAEGYNTYVKNVNPNSLKVGDLLIRSLNGKTEIYMCKENNQFLNVDTKEIMNKIPSTFDTLPFNEYFAILSPALKTEEITKSEEKPLSIEKRVGKIFVEKNKQGTKYKVYVPTSTKNQYVEYILERATRNDIKLDCFGIIEVKKAIRNSNGAFTEGENLTTRGGNFELAVSTADSPDKSFVGYTAHGNEIIKGKLKISYDGNDLTMLPAGIYECSKVVASQLSNVYDYYNNNKLAMTHYVEWRFDVNGVEVYQDLRFKDSYKIGRAHLVMFPIRRGNDKISQNVITDSFYVNDDTSKIYDASEMKLDYGGNMKDAKKYTLYSNESGVVGTVELLKRIPSLDSKGGWVANYSEDYNKVYFEFVNRGYVTKPQELWTSKARYNFDILK